MQPLIVDAHQDLAYNILTFGRDYSRSVSETRQIEVGTDTPAHNGNTLLGWPEYQRGRVALVFATLFAPPQRAKTEAWEKLSYASVDEAHRIYRAQLETYDRLTDQRPDQFRFVRTGQDLDAVLADWEDQSKEYHPTGLVALMESAEAVRSPAELGEWWELGLRILGPAWAGTRFCGGTREPGPLTVEGETLLEAMADLGYLLDLSHMDTQAQLQALDRYPGEIIASHANAAALLKDDSNRHLTDDVIHSLLARDGVVGIIPLNSFLLSGWRRGDGRHLVTLQHVVAQIDYICQIAGDAAHVGLGTDFDGGFGVESTPQEIDTIADLHLLVPLLGERGYTEDDIAAIFSRNWLRKLSSILKESE
jgi:membrane dipeptidase